MNRCDLVTVCNLVTEELHELGLVAASLQFVEERSELLVIEFYPSIARNAFASSNRVTFISRSPLQISSESA